MKPHFDNLFLCNFQAEGEVYVSKITKLYWLTGPEQD